MNRLHMLKNATHTQMQSFIIEEETGKLLVIDGGNYGDALHLLEKLREITGQQVPHVDAWFFTHAHSDHMNAFNELMDKHPGAVEFDAIYCNFPSLQYLGLEEKDAPKTLGDFIRYSPRFAEKIVTVSMDDIYTFGSCTIEILQTVDTSVKENIVNNSSVVFKMQLGAKSILFLGDLGVEGGRRLLQNKKDRLKSDLCQMAHHGQNGVEREVYEAIAPEACLWCAPDWLYNNDRGKGYNTHIYQTVIVRGWMEELGVKTHYCIKDGDQTVEC
ncbi:MAG: MBL fold metallo-hydrolase [Clostridia bacterium]|nr:MBL fold metallo-hydrolase [Clostridia bacterium]